MGCEKELKGVSVQSTKKRFAEALPETELSRELRIMTEQQQYEDWKQARYVLAHRSLPGRTFHETGQYKPADWFEGVTIDTGTTASRRQWLPKTLATIITASEAFLTERQPLLAAGDASRH